jgi:hypothetical protein
VTSGDSLQLSGFIIGTLGHFPETPPDTSNDPRYNTATIDVLKSAVGGTTCAQALAAYASTVAPFYDGRRKANVASLGCGTNDYTGGRTTTATYADIVSFVAAAKATGYTVVVNTLPSAQRFDTVPGDAWRTDLNSKITGGAVTNGYLVADEASDPDIGCKTCYLNATYFTDGTHMTTAGWNIKGGYTYTILVSLGFQ